MREDKEILDRIRNLDEFDILGFQTSDLILRLPFDLAKEFLKPEAKEEEWKQYPRDRESLIKEMLEYMPFAWEKANNDRGISAARSMAHYNSWIWLVGDDLGDMNDYQFYGKDNLVNICDHYGWDSSQWDDGIRHN